MAGVVVIVDASVAEAGGCEAQYLSRCYRVDKRQEVARDGQGGPQVRDHGRVRGPADGADRDRLRPVWLRAGAERDRTVGLGACHESVRKWATIRRDYSTAVPLPSFGGRG